MKTMIIENMSNARNGNRQRFGSDTRKIYWQNDEELAFKMLQIQDKRFYLDFKENIMGLYFKIVQLNAVGKKSRISLSWPTAIELRDHLTNFIEFYTSMNASIQENSSGNNILKTEIMVKDNRIYYIDLKVITRGKVLQISQTRRGGPRSQIAIPVQGMIEFKDALEDLLEWKVNTDNRLKGVLPEGRQLHLDDKSSILTSSKII